MGNKTFGRVDIGDLESERRYRSFKTYGEAKLGDILYTKELHRRYHDAGISTVAFHPGNVASNFGSESHSRVLALAYRTPVKHLALIGPEKGSDELVWLASSKPGTEWTPGEYYSNHKIAKANRQAYDPALASELWEPSLAMVA